MIELNEDTIYILGQPNFACAPIANAMRCAGIKIPHKAEVEQAHVIHWMLGLYEKHGASWREHGANQLDEWADIVKEKAAP